MLAGLGALTLLMTAFAASVVAGIVRGGRRRRAAHRRPAAHPLRLALYRVTLELFLVIFRMHEDLKVIRDRGGI